jgi:hypothetical protein
MTAKQMIPKLDSLATVRFEQVLVACRIVDVKSAYGKTRVQVQPIEGLGEQWVEMDRVSIVNERKYSWQSAA